MAESHSTEMPEEPPHATLIGPEGDRRLLFTREETWLPDGSDELSDKIYIACKTGHVDVSEMR